MSKVLGTVAVLSHDNPSRAVALHDAVSLARKYNAPAYVKPCSRGWEATLDKAIPSWCSREFVWVVSQFGAVVAL